MEGRAPQDAAQNRTRRQPREGDGTGPSAGTGSVDVDADLLSRAGSGDADAFRLLVDRHRRLIERVCRQLCDTDDIEDAVQWCLLALWRGAGSYQGRSRVSTWMYSVCLREALRVAVSARRRPPLTDVGRGGGEVDTVVEEPRIEDIDELRRALADLSPDQRAVLFLRYWLDLPFRDIARILGDAHGRPVSEGAARLRELAARRALVSRLGRLHQPGEGVDQRSEGRP